ncbi:hypothetical protein MCANPG14_02675 [Mycoplasmopsis canis PG 14]|uniref:hypothetical protein n=1 Tax=Mycoplasmopsis canis TaxID=29555 RepID=UPI00025AD96F|nr:hypothetical protein [Mycoplasmopsis canis]EIE39407.1 hypothetical protein MCANPG14_02675 [Mycoplasmopsis canis PG 14]
MKKIKYLAFLSLLTPAVITSCVNNDYMQSSKYNIKSLNNQNKEVINTISKLENDLPSIMNNVIKSESVELYNFVNEQISVINTKIKAFNKYIVTLIYKYNDKEITLESLIKELELKVNEIKNIDSNLRSRTSNLVFPSKKHIVPSLQGKNSFDIETSQEPKLQLYFKSNHDLKIDNNLLGFLLFNKSESISILKDFQADNWKDLTQKTEKVYLSLNDYIDSRYEDNNRIVTTDYILFNKSFLDYDYFKNFFKQKIENIIETFNDEWEKNKTLFPSFVSKIQNWYYDLDYVKKESTEYNRENNDYFNLLISNERILSLNSINNIKLKNNIIEFETEYNWDYNSTIDSSSTQKEEIKTNTWFILKSFKQSLKDMINRLSEKLKENTKNLMIKDYSFDLFKEALLDESGEKNKFKLSLLNFYNFIYQNYVATRRNIGDKNNEEQMSTFKDHYNTLMTEIRNSNNNNSIFWKILDSYKENQKNNLLKLDEYFAGNKSKSIKMINQFIDLMKFIESQIEL